MSEPVRAVPLQPGTVRLWNALACRMPAQRFTLNNGQADAPRVMVTCPIMENDGFFAEGAAFTLYMNFNGLWRVEFSSLDLLLLRPELALWLQADVANRFAMLPDGLVRAVLERLFLYVLDDISHYTGMPAIFVGKPRASTRPMFTEHLDLLLRVEGQCPVSCLLRIAWQDTATLMPVVERLEAQPLPYPSQQVKSLLAGAEVSARLVLGSMHMTPEELVSLHTGDVLLPSLLLPGEPRLCLASGLRLVCALNGSTLTVCALESSCGPIIHGEQNMSETTEENAAQQDAVSKGQAAAPVLGQENLGTLELDITFELPGLRLPLVECSRLAPGYTFTLSADAAHLPVTVLAGGRAVAVGRLVDVGGTLGVQLTQMVGAAVRPVHAVKEGD